MCSTRSAWCAASAVLAIPLHPIGAALSRRCEGAVPATAGTHGAVGAGRATVGAVGEEAVGCAGAKGAVAVWGRQAFAVIHRQ